MPTDNEILNAYISMYNEEPPTGYYTALANAKHKLGVILNRFGDADGDRLTAGYIAQLVHEDLIATAYEGFTMQVTKTLNKADEEYRKIKEARSSSSYSRPAIIDIITHLYSNTVAASCQ